MYAKRSLGQNFLKSERALGKIVEAAELKEGEVVLEIGPGKGALTEKLLASGVQLTAIEKDDDLYEFLKEKFEKEISAGRFTLIHGDILEYDISKLQALSYKLVANIPYNITGAILKKFLSGTPSASGQPKLMVLLVQKEVAERIVARPHSAKATRGKESILSISVKVYGEPKLIETVKAGSFVPAPQVDSAIVSIKNISREFFGKFEAKDAEKRFFDMLRAGFKSKRKKLVSNLSTIYPRDRVLEVFRKLSLDENVRAEDISPEIWQKLARMVLK